MDDFDSHDNSITPSSISVTSPLAAPAPAEHDGISLPSSSSSLSKSARTGPEQNKASSSSSSKGKQPLIIDKDEDYFMESAFMVFQVERCLFRVPSYLFEKESHIFLGMFRLPQPHAHENGVETEAEGSSEANPFVLPDEFTKKDFRCLLKALYPLSFTLRLFLTKEEWLSVLKLSTKWYFLNLRKTAISELESPYPSPSPITLSSLENITYGRKYRLSSWLVSGLVDLVMRDEMSITDDEALDIDSDYPTTAYKLFRMRELRLRGFLTSRNDVEKEIEGLFCGELSLVRADEKAYEAPEVEIELPKPEAFPVSPMTVDEKLRYEEELLLLAAEEKRNSELEAEEKRRALLGLKKKKKHKINSSIFMSQNPGW